MSPTEWKVYFALSEYLKRGKPIEAEIHHEDETNGRAYFIHPMIGVHIIPLLVQGFVEEVEKV